MGAGLLLRMLTSFLTLQVVVAILKGAFVGGVFINGMFGIHSVRLEGELTFEIDNLFS